MNLSPNIIWLISCLLVVLINSLMGGIVVYEFMKFGYNVYTHFSISLNLIFTFSGVILIHKYLIDKGMQDVRPNNNNG